MLFGGEDDDDSDFSLIPGSGSKLSNLFGGVQASEQKGNVSLQYTPPKQPKKGDQGGNKGPSLVVVHAAAVHAYKFENGKHNSQGKLGAAILGDKELSVYKLLLYKGKEQQIALASISLSFAYLVQSNNYASFYDDKKDNWSIMFESEQNCIEYAKQIALAKANSSGSNTSLIIQDLKLGEGPSLENADSAEVKYTGWLLKNQTFGEVFDSNANSEKLLRLKLGKGKVIKGWEEGLIGAKKNVKRLLIIPPSLAYGSQGFGNKVPPDSTLIFELFINKVKVAREASRSSTPTVGESGSGDLQEYKKPEGQTRPHSDSLNSDDSIRARGASISEQLSQSPKTEKAKIISRMAKMGMPMLPMQGTVAAQPSSESETEEELQNKSQSSSAAPPPRSRESSPKPVPKPRSTSFGPVGSYQGASAPTQAIPQSQPVVHPSQQQVAMLHSAGMQHQNFLPSTYYQQPAQISPYSVPTQQPFPGLPVAQTMPTVVTSVADSHLPLLLSETRNQNTEVRLSLGKLCDKMDMVLHKVDEFKSQQQNSSLLQSQVPYMESSVLMNNIQRIVQENSRLKQELEDKTTKIQNLNEKICDLLQRNQKFMETSAMMLEERNDSIHNSATQSQLRLLNLEQERAKLSSDLADITSQYNALKIEFSACSQEKDELAKSLQNSTVETSRQKETANALKDQVKENESSVISLQNKLKELSDEKNQLESTVESFRKKLTDLNASNQALEKNSKSEDEVRMEWQKKSEKAIADATDKFMKEINALKIEKDELAQKTIYLQKKLESEEAQKIQESTSTQEQWKSKYDALLSQTEAIKGKCIKYDAQVLQLSEEIVHLKSSRTSTPSDKESTQHFESQLKKVMNGLYRSFQTEFKPRETYVKADILRIILSTIREVTLQLLEANQPTGSEEISVATQSEESRVQVPTDSGKLKAEQSPERAIESHSEKAIHTEEPLTNNADDEQRSDIPEVNGQRSNIPNINQAADFDRDDEDRKDAKDSKEETKERLQETAAQIAAERAKTPELWKPKPPPPPLFDDDEDEDDWLN